MYKLFKAISHFLDALGTITFVSLETVDYISDLYFPTPPEEGDTNISNLVNYINDKDNICEKCGVDHDEE